ncbi:MAG TPA: ABC transporter permease [Gammaproteobacteria bacterium]|nr:ABC transporter permease [Gammaproteobacteria bacterium]
MYSFIESFRSALISIRAHGFRSFLTTLGIIIGVMAVIAVVSLIQGFSHNITNQFKGLGTNSMMIFAYTPYKERLLGKDATITPADLEAIKHQVRGISNVTPIVQPSGVLQYRGQSTATLTRGTTSSFPELEQVWPSEGRFFNFSDMQSRRRVIVIGQTVRDNLHLPDNPIGEFVRFGDEWFKVIGVFEKRGQFFGRDQDDIAIMPFTTALSIMGTADEPDIQIILSVDQLSHAPAVKAQITRLLRKRHHLRADQPDDFRVRTSQQLMETVTGLLNTVTLVLGGIVAISLLVGGIGIMNIMLVSVTERTREIGICKSLGARRRDILLQFLIESVTLSLLGGVIGVVLGYAIGIAASNILPNFGSATVPWWIVLLAFAFSAGVGVIFGIIPAAKAANMNPIDALRYE